MATTFYDTLVNWVPAHGQPNAGESYTRLPDGTGYKVTLGPTFYFSDSTYIFADISGDLNPGWETLSVTWYHDPWGAPSRNILSNTITRFRAEYHFYVTDSDSNPLEGVGGLGSDLGSGNYRSRETTPVTKTFTPVKAGYEFDLISFINESRSAYVTVQEVAPYKVVNPGPEDDAIDINRVTNLTWETGEQTADDYNVWFGTPGNMVLVGTQVSNLYFDIADYTGGLALDTEYEWRIDSYVNNELVATGSTWSYTTRAQRTVVLSLPANIGTDVLLQPLLVWTIDGIGAQYGSFEDQDFLFIYLRKDDANFTEDDLIGNFVQAFANDDLQVVAGLEYEGTYYWQVQAGNTAADLADSEVWSFTVQVFSPPAYSVHPVSGLPTGESNQITVQRLVAIANNKFWYEDI